MMNNFDMKDCVLVIPARMSGTRLPGKPLIPILGKPMIQHVIERCSKVVPRDEIFVVTEDVAIVEFVSALGFNVIKTKYAATAIDRIYLFSQIVDARSYITVLGDEPLINPRDIETIIKAAHKNPERVIMGRAKATLDEFNDPSKAKVVCALDGRLLYSSRAGIPVDKNGKYSSAHRAIWIYSFPKESLLRYHEASDRVILEPLEGNEIIRFLEINEPVYCIDVTGDSWAVDELKDLVIVENVLSSQKVGL
jgi:3-deoxy-manno-octulosonate cytidylyltransferase (CMP-KDO synthetase)